MRRGRVAAVGLCVVLGVVSMNSHAAKVLVISTSYDPLNAETVASLESYGHEAIIGQPYHLFDGSVSLAGIDAALVLVNYNWSLGDMPPAGQTALLNFIDNGGGLVTGEWFVWKNAAQNSFATLYDAIPVVSTAAFTTNAGVNATTYTRATPNLVLNAGLLDSIGFTADYFGGTETKLDPKPGATVFYDSNNPLGGDGLIGWNYGDGRVLSFSTTIGSQQLAHAGFSRLLANTLAFAAGDGTLVVLGDMNGDGALDAFDVAPFELALADRTAYAATYPGLDPDVFGDMNFSGELDAFDVSAFEAALAGGGMSVPEPAAGMLLGLLALTCPRRRIV